MAANTITLASGKDAASLQVLFTKMNHVYFYNGQITTSKLTAGLECVLELPVLSDGVSFNMGEPDKQETKLTTGVIWTSRADKGDSDISFQVASIAGPINELFMRKPSVSIPSVKLGTSLGFNAEKTFNGVAYSSEVKKVQGSLLMTDDNGATAIVLPNVEMYGGLVVADGDNPAYFNVSVTPKINTEGSDIMIFQESNGGAVNGGQIS